MATDLGPPEPVGASAAPADGREHPPSLGPTDRRPDIGRAWGIVLGVDLGLLGLFVVLAVVAAFMPAQQGAVDVQATRSALWVQNIFAFVVMGLVPFVWVWRTRVGGWSGALDYLGLRRPLVGMGLGVLALLAIYVVVSIISIILSRLAPGLLENPQVEALGLVLSWPLVIVTAVVAGVAEEILFRGVLQKWVGLWGQALLFGLVHASYATALQVVLPFLIGLGFGYMVRRGWPLWAPITAHFLFDLVALSVTKYCQDGGAVAVCGA